MPSYESDRRKVEQAEQPLSDRSEDLAAFLQQTPGTMIVGRGLSPEYDKMFELNLPQLSHDTRILDVSGGVASFAAEMHLLGYDHVHAADPLYRFTAGSIEKEALPFISNWDEKFVDPNTSFDEREGGAAEWLVSDPLPEIDTPAKMLELRRRSLELFKNDFEARGSDIYIPTELPDLEGVRGPYDLILCANFLMAYTSKDIEMTVASIEGMAAQMTQDGEIRIYPGGKAFESMENHIREALLKKGLYLEVRPSEHKFVVGWDSMYVIRSV